MGSTFFFKTLLIKYLCMTMGGLLILLSLIISVLLWTDLTNSFVWIVIGLTTGYGILDTF